MMNTFIKFTPILAFICLVIFAKFDILVSGAICTFLAIFVSMIVNKKKFGEVFNIGLESAKDGIIAGFILMFAYAVAEVFLATGVGASIIEIALNMGITAKTVALVGFLVTCGLSVATGTSWGTFAACAPVFLWLNYIVGGNILLTAGSIVGGCCFGDNIGLISDTTVLSSGLQNVEIVHRVRHQGVWSIGCVVVSAIVIFLVSMGLPGETGNAVEAIQAIPAESWQRLEEARPSAILLLEQVQNGIPLYMVIPIIIVIGLAIKGAHTILCLGSGMVSALVFGYFAGTVTSVTEFFNGYVNTAFGDAGSWTVIALMWITAFGGIMRSMNAFEPLTKFMLRFSGKVRHLLTWNALLCIVGNAVFADENSMIAIMSPIIKNVTDESVEASEEDMYKIRLRNATFADALGVYSAQFIPWHACVVFYLSISASVYPLYTFTPFSLVSMNFMAIIAVVSILVLTFTGLDRFIPLFKLPSEPDVRLRKNVGEDMSFVPEKLGETL